MTEETQGKPITFLMSEDDILVGGIAILEVVDSETSQRMMKYAIFNSDTTIWQQIGWLEARLAQLRKEV